MQEVKFNSLLYKVICSVSECFATSGHHVHRMEAVLVKLILTISSFLYMSFFPFPSFRCACVCVRMCVRLWGLQGGNGLATCKDLWWVCAWLREIRVWHGLLCVSADQVFVLLLSLSFCGCLCGFYIFFPVCVSAHLICERWNTLQL